MHPAAPAFPTSRQEDVALCTGDVMKAWHKLHMGSRCQKTLEPSPLVRQTEVFMSLSSILGKMDISAQVRSL